MELRTTGQERLGERPNNLNHVVAVDDHQRDSSLTGRGLDRFPPRPG